MYYMYVPYACTPLVLSHPNPPSPASNRLQSALHILCPALCKCGFKDSKCFSCEYPAAVLPGTASSDAMEQRGTG